MGEDWKKPWCKACIAAVVQEESASIREELVSSVKNELLASFQSVRGSLASTPSTQPSTSQSSQEVVVLSSGPSVFEEVSLGQPQDPSSGESETEEETGSPAKFKLSLEEVDNLLIAIYATLGLGEEKKDLSLHDRMYAGLCEPKGRTFPVHSVISETILREWQEPEKKPFFSKSHKRRFPFGEDPSAIWNKVPKLDAAFSQVSRSTDLSFEDMGLLKDPMDKRMDLLLKKAWQSILINLKPAMATTCVARNLEYWVDQLKAHIEADSPKQDILDSFSTIAAAVAYMADASAEAIKFSARSAALANSARRALWLKTWPGDAASKSKLCGIPFSGDLLFDPELESILDRTADKKKAFPVKAKNPPPKRFFRAHKQQNKGKGPQGKRGWSAQKGKGKGVLFNPPAQTNKPQGLSPKGRRKVGKFPSAVVGSVRQPVHSDHYSPGLHYRVLRGPTNKIFGNSDPKRSSEGIGFKAGVHP